MYNNNIARTFNMYFYYIVFIGVWCIIHVQRIYFSPTNKYKSRLIHYPVSEKKALITDVMRLPVMSALSREKIQTDRARVLLDELSFPFLSFLFPVFLFLFLCSYYYYRHQGPNFYLFIVAFLTLWKIYLKIKKIPLSGPCNLKGKCFIRLYFSCFKTTRN